MEAQIDWSKASIEDYRITKKMTERAKEIIGDENVDEQSLQMDIVATHISGCKLKLKQLLKAPVGDFLHDICGIRKHIDRSTGKLLDCFLPRYAVKAIS